MLTFSEALRILSTPCSPIPLILTLSRYAYLLTLYAHLLTLYAHLLTLWTKRTVRYTGEPRYASQVKLLLKLANAGLDLNRVSIGYETMGVDVFHQLQVLKPPSPRYSNPPLHGTHSSTTDLLPTTNNNMM